MKKKLTQQLQIERRVAGTIEIKNGQATFVPYINPKPKKIIHFIPYYAQ